VNVRTLSLLDGAQSARGIAVIIDVFRASSTIVAAFAAGARRIIPVGELDAAYEAKRRNPEFLLFGERSGLPPEGFDHGNSPAETSRLDLRGKTIILTTSAGSQGLVSARQADEIIVGCFANARAAADYIAAAQPSQACLVAMGVGAEKKALEDETCAQYIRALLLGEPFDLQTALAAILQDREAQKFLDPNSPLYNPGDVDFCLKPNAYGIVPRYDAVRGITI